MKLAQSYKYKGIPIAINIDPIAEVGYISYMDKARSIKSMDIDKLRIYAENLIDQEKNGVIYHSMY